MLAWLPAISYPSPKNGYWLPVTSTLNWCEEVRKREFLLPIDSANLEKDYYATRYVAEIVNTFTNFLFLFLAARGIRNCLKYDHDRIFLIAFMGYGFVGSGSFLFHATLKYPMQLLDELSMIYTACFMFYATFTHFRYGRFHPWLAVSLISLALSITLYYHYLQDPVFHQNAYALLTIIVLTRSIWIMEKYLRPRAKNEAPHDPSSMTAILSRMWIMVAYGITIFLSGFAIWGLDRKFCALLISWRHQIGLPWGIFLEGHGWWHVMTGIGAYFYIVWVIWLRYCLNGKQTQYKLVWPSVVFSFPDVISTSQEEQASPTTMNGTAQALRKNE